MPNSYDPYREALVIEQETVWPESLTAAPSATRSVGGSNTACTPIPPAAELEYVRLHAGFIRKITVTAADLTAAS